MKRHHEFCSNRKVNLWGQVFPSYGTVRYGRVQGIYVRCLSLVKLLPSLVSCLAGCFCIVCSIRRKFLIFDVEPSVGVFACTMYVFAYVFLDDNGIKWNDTCARVCVQSFEPYGGCLFMRCDIECEKSGKIYIFVVSSVSTLFTGFTTN